MSCSSTAAFSERTFSTVALRLATCHRGIKVIKEAKHIRGIRGIKEAICKRQNGRPTDSCKFYELLLHLSIRTGISISVACQLQMDSLKTNIGVTSSTYQLQIDTYSKQIISPHLRDPCPPSQQLAAVLNSSPPDHQHQHQHH